MAYIVSGDYVYFRVSRLGLLVGLNVKVSHLHIQNFGDSVCEAAARLFGEALVQAFTFYCAISALTTKKKLRQGVDGAIVGDRLYVPSSPLWAIKETQARYVKKATEAFVSLAS